jgi:CheY-like chemotaxis protein
MATILTVEDEESQRKAICNTLIQNGYSILEAENGVQGLEIALSKHPDVILLDVRMPKMDGITLMNELRKDPWGAKANIIILTNYDPSDAQLIQLTKGLPTYFLIKSDSTLSSIVEKVKEVLDPGSAVSEEVP